MDTADKFSMDDGMTGRLRAVECAIQALILTHPDPDAFSETLQAIARAVSNRSELDERTMYGQSREGFHDGCHEFCRTAEVAQRTPTKGPGLSDLADLQA